MPVPLMKQGPDYRKACKSTLRPFTKLKKAFLKSVAFADSFPFSAPSVDAEALSEYWKRRNALRDLYGDETNQLDGLTKVIRTKKYSEEEKKQLYLLLLGYIDIADSVFELLDSRSPSKLPNDEELDAIKSRFQRIKMFARLNVRGLKGIF